MVRQFFMNGALMPQKKSTAVHILLSILVMPAYIVTVVKLQPSTGPWNNHGHSCAVGYRDHLNRHGTYRSGCNAMGIQEPRNPGMANETVHNISIDQLKLNSSISIAFLYYSNIAGY